MSFKDHFSSHADDYAAFRPSYPPELARYLASLTPAHDLAWDAGCGTGQLSLLLAEHYGRVRATDASAEQITRAAAHPKITYATAPAQQSGLPPGAVDLVTVAQAAHWFDLPAFYAEVRRVAKEHAVIALISYGMTETDGPLDAAVSGFYHEVIGPFWPPERVHVENAYRDLPFPFEELATPGIAMRARWGARELLGYISTWSAIRPAQKRLGREPFVKFHEEVTAIMGDQLIEIRWPLALRVGRVKPL